MAIKKFKPTSPGRRQMTSSTFEEITTSTPEKSLLVPGKKSGGRNNAGRITQRHSGGGHKQRYRLIGQHGGVSAGEMRVPLVVISR